MGRRGESTREGRRESSAPRREKRERRKKRTAALTALLSTVSSTVSTLSSSVSALSTVSALSSSVSSSVCESQETRSAESVSRFSVESVGRGSPSRTEPYSARKRKGKGGHSHPPPSAQGKIDGRGQFRVGRGRGDQRGRRGETKRTTGQTSTGLKRINKRDGLDSSRRSRW